MLGADVGVAEGGAEELVAVLAVAGAPLPVVLVVVVVVVVGDGVPGPSGIAEEEQPAPRVAKTAQASTVAMR